MTKKSHDDLPDDLNDDMPPKEGAAATLLGHAEQEELMKQLNEAEQKSAQYWDRILRMQADMENASRRSERELANAYKFGIEKFLTELLPVIDNLERAIAAASESPSDTKAILEGVSMTLKMLQDVLEKAGVKQVDPLNEVFNPSFHEAISTQADAALKPGTVVAVLQKGYVLNERLVRPALVVVSK